MRNQADAIGQVLIPLLATVAAIGLLTIAIYVIRSWLRENDGPAASAHELLAEYREMNRRGELSDEEFRIIKGRMASSIGRGPVAERKPDRKPEARVAVQGKCADPGGQEVDVQVDRSEPGPESPRGPDASPGERSSA